AEDAITVLEQATTEEKPGVFNVAGVRLPTLSRAIRRCRRRALPGPRPVMTPVGKVLRGAHAVNVSADLVRLLNFGRVVDTTRLVREFGYSPRWTTRQAFDEAVRTATSWRGRLRR